MNILRRLKNLWELSEYRTGMSPIEGKKVLVKDFPTIQKKPATIVMDKVDFFEEEKQDD